MIGRIYYYKRDLENKTNRFFVMTSEHTLGNSYNFDTYIEKQVVQNITLTKGFVEQYFILQKRLH